MMRMNPWVPGPGFVFVVVTLLGASSFFAWGLQQPPLDRAWKTQIELQLGEGKLSKGDFANFQSVLHRHPGVADNILEGRPAGLVSAHDNGYVDSGYAYLVRRTSQTPSSLRLWSPPGLADADLKIQVTTSVSKEKHSFEPGQPLNVTLPQGGPFPQLIEVKLGNKKTRKKRLPVLVQLPNAESQRP